MACCTNTNYRSADCINNLLRKIDSLQRRAVKKEDESCSRDYLGNPGVCFYNTRPVVLYNCGNMPFEFPVTNAPACDNQEETSCVLRIEKVENGCATFRVLIPTNDNGYEGTSSFVTVRTCCIASIRCLPDISLDICF